MGTSLKKKPVRRVWNLQMRMMIWSAALGCALIHFARNAAAQQAGANPFGLSYTGQIFNAEGKPVNGRIDVEVSFASDRNGTNKIGSVYTYPNIDVRDGIFTIDFANTLSEYSSIFTGNQEVWIQVRDKTNNIVFDWSQYRAVPYALKVPTDNKTLSFGSDGKLKLNAPLPTNNGQMLTGNTDGSLVWQTPPAGGGGGSITNITTGTGLTGGGSTATVNLAVDVGTTANKIVQLDATGKLPAVDGSQLTGITASSFTGQGALATANSVSGGVAGTIADSSITNADINSSAAIATSKLSGPLTAVSGHGLGSAATMDVGTTANKVIQLDGAAKLPAVDGSLLMNVTVAASNITGVIPNAKVSFDAPGPIGQTTPSTGNFTALTTGANGISLQDNDGTTHYAVIKAAPSMAGTQTYTLPPAAIGGKYLRTSSDGTLSWDVPAGGDMNKATYDVEPNGVIDLAAGGTGASTASGARTNLGLGTAAMQNVGVAANNVVQLDGSANLPALNGSQLTNITGTNIVGVIPSARLDLTSPSVIGSVAPNSANFTEIRLVELPANGTEAITIKAPSSLATNLTFTWPPDDYAGKFLTTDGAGNLSWGVPSALSSGTTDGAVQYRNGSGFGSSNQFLWENTTGRLVVRSIGPYNMFMGFRSAEAYVDAGGLGRNVVLGEESGKVMNSSASENTLLGTMAGYGLIGGDRNILIGAMSGQHLVSGAENVMVGTEVGFQVTGSGNTLLGSRAGFNFGSGNDNTIIGYDSGNNSVAGTGEGNVIIGKGAGFNNSGNFNVLVGMQARTMLASDGSASAIGHNSRAAMNSIALGFDAAAVHQGSIAIGKSALTTQVQQLRIGSESEPISDVVIGAGDLSTTAWNPVKIRVNSSSSSGSPLELIPGSGQSGGDLILNGGQASTSNGGNVIIKTNDMGAPVERVVITRFGKVGIGTNAPMATLDVAGFVKLQRYSSPPIACVGGAGGSATGTIVLTNQNMLCVCNGTTWVKTADGTTTCSW